jgi:hypothetical protein
MRNEIDDFNYEKLKTLHVTIYWKKTANTIEPISFIFLYFPNSFCMFLEGFQEYITVADSIEFQDIKTSDHINNIVDIMRKGEPSEEELSKFYKENNYGVQNGPMDSAFKTEFLEGEIPNTFSILKSNKVKNTYSNSNYHQYKPITHIADLFDYCNVNRKNVTEVGTTITIWNLLAFILIKSLVMLDENRPKYEELADILYSFEKDENYTDLFDSISANFKELFPNTDFKILIDKKKNERGILEEHKYVLIIETVQGSTNSFRLTVSASGYYEALSIFTSISSQSASIIVLDEPALHLHPSKIRYLGRLLMKMLMKQIVVITHSPFFIEPFLLSIPRNLIYLKREGKNSRMFSKPDDFNCMVTPSLFRPEIFFSKFIILVEGAGDAAVFTAISDGFEGIFEKKDIFVLAAGGTGNVKNYQCLLEIYAIEFAAMVDFEYEHKTNEKFEVLEFKLESELQKLGWAGNTTNSIDPDEAYNFVSNLMQSSEGMDKIRNSVFGKLIILAVTTVGCNNPFGNI